MVVNPVVWQRALKLRNAFVSEFLKYHGPTDADAGRCLVKLARVYQYSNRTRDIPGKTLRSWLSPSSMPPQWAVKTMIIYLLQHGYVAESLDELEVVIAYMLVDVDDPLCSTILSQLKQLMPSTPEQTLNKALSTVCCS